MGENIDEPKLSETGAGFGTQELHLRTELKHKESQEYMQEIIDFASDRHSETEKQLELYKKGIETLKELPPDKAEALNFTFGEYYRKQFAEFIQKASGFEKTSIPEATKQFFGDVMSSLEHTHKPWTTRRGEERQ